MSSFRRYGGLNFSGNNNITKSYISNSEQMNITNYSGQPNSNEVFASNIDMSGNSILDTGTIYFQDGTSMSSSFGQTEADLLYLSKTKTDTSTAPITTFNGQINAKNKVVVGVNGINGTNLEVLGQIYCYDVNTLATDYGRILNGGTGVMLYHSYSPVGGFSTKHRFYSSLNGQDNATDRVLSFETGAVLTKVYNTFEVNGMTSNLGYANNISDYSVFTTYYNGTTADTSTKIGSISYVQQSADLPITSQQQGITIVSIKINKGIFILNWNLNIRNTELFESDTDKWKALIKINVGLATSHNFNPSGAPSSNGLIMPNSIELIPGSCSTAFSTGPPLKVENGTYRVEHGSCVYTCSDNDKLIYLNTYIISNNSDYDKFKFGGSIQAVRLA